MLRIKLYSALVVAAITLLYQFFKLHGLLRAKSWPSVTGQIIESRLLLKGENGRKSTDPLIRYEYTVNGKKFTGNTSRKGGDMFINNEAQAALVARYPNGHHVPVYYDPNNPADACLDKGGASSIVLTIGVALLGGSICLYQMMNPD